VTRAVISEILRGKTDTKWQKRKGLICLTKKITNGCKTTCYQVLIASSNKQQLPKLKHTLPYQVQLSANWPPLYTGLVLIPFLAPLFCTDNKKMQKYNKSYLYRL